MFTYVAAHIVVGQLMNLSPRINTSDGAEPAGSDGAHVSLRSGTDYDTLLGYLEQHPARSRRCLSPPP